MTAAILRLAALTAFAAGLGAQFLLQHGHLRHANEVRSARILRTSPSSLAFRLAAGGVKEAAADALWLTVLPKLGQSWVEPARKAAWVEAVTTVMVDANPRALTPPLYAAFFLEFAEKRHPGIERILRRAMDAERRAPFEERRRVNRDSWELPEALGMNIYLWERDARPTALHWLREAASRPEAPLMLVEFAGAIAAREGSPLDAWELWLLRADNARKREWREHFLREADRARLGVLRGWARAAEGRLGEWPRALDEVLAEAPPAVAEALRSRQELRGDLLREVVLLPRTRDMEIPSLTKHDREKGLEALRLLVNRFETEKGRRPAALGDLQSVSPVAIAPPPRHGTKWGLDPATGEPCVVPDQGDPRLTR